MKDILKEEVRYDREMMEEYTDQLTILVMNQLEGSIVNHFNLERDLTSQEILNLKKIAKDKILRKLQKTNVK